MWSGAEQYQILANSSMGLSELKILEAYVNKAKFSGGRALVVFKKNELEELLGVGKINRSELEKRMDCLFMQRIPVLDGSFETNAYTPLFERCELKRDIYGVWSCYLVATNMGINSLFPETARKRIADRFDNAKKLSSRYSYLLYRYLDDCTELGEWEVDLDELKEIIGCTKESYDSFKAFNHIILKKCQREIIEETGLVYDYELIKYIRKVKGIRFIIRNPEHDEDRIAEVQNEAFNRKYKERIKFFSGACDNEFSEDEVELIVSILSDVSIPENPNGAEIAKYNYLNEKYKTFKVYANRKQSEGNPIRHRFDYFVKMLKNARDGQQ
jgi:hypothetical protein